MSQHNTHGEGIVDIGAGVLLSIGTYIATYGEHLIIALITGAVGAVGSIIVRVIYKKWFKKYFEKK